MQNDISLDCESVDTQGLIRRNPRKVYRFFHPQVQKKKMDALRKIRDGRELKNRMMVRISLDCGPRVMIPT